VVDRFGARWAMGVGALAGLAAAAVAVAYLVRHRGLRVVRDSGRVRLETARVAVDPAEIRLAAGERVK
jgi:hypothetical protein